ncbi:Disease resistance protein [Melia azedarach]|uniref:Disease resistance protein n=1 Tax=Melia azedarach TaxID=155640 RepID=A0ACC1Y2P8_MELAZ|nr:Disease resistance protein [Melia azedarach]
MAEALVSLVLEQLTSILGLQTEAEVELIVGVDEEVQKLNSNFRAIRAVLEDAENRQVKENAVRDWLDKLKEVSYDADDVLDEWNTAIQKLRMEKGENASKNETKVCSLIPSYCFSPRQVFLRRDIAIKIKGLNKRLENDAREKDMFNFSLTNNGGTKELVRPMTTSFSDEPKVYGRDQVKNDLLNLLLSGSCQGPTLPIISIVGMGGIGKTTLAQLAFNDERVKNHFDIKIWVCVSDPFDEIRIAKAILESIKGKAPSLVELHNVLQDIHHSIEGKKFFLVLDDVWTEDHKNWGQLKGSLMCGSQESRILVTTRKKNTANIMGTTNMIPLGILSGEDCWSLFKQVAFFGRTNEECQKLESIGRRIVWKCKGLPLAVKSLGSLLHFKRKIEEWQRVLDSEFWELEEVERGLFPPLLLSYYDLPSKLRKCFLHCAIFPKDYRIYKDKLIKLWMAQGYLNLKGREDMELVGEEYFENLAMRSFFQDFRNDDDGNVRSCKMHDIVHDFSQFLTNNECFDMEVDGLEEFHSEVSFSKVRHSMIVLKGGGSFPISICNARKLRSFVLDCEDDFVARIAHSKLVDKFTCLRTMDLVCGYFCDSINEFPRAINKFIHLRYLSWSRNLEIKELPEVLCDLYNLQTLDLSHSIALQKLPQGIGKLINLRHLINEGTHQIKYMPKGLKRLTGLRTLNVFNVSAKLKNKNSLLRLRLWFNNEDADGMLNEVNEAVLEALEPPPNLERLEILFYESIATFPNWMLSLTMLKALKLYESKHCKHLPCLGKLPSLEDLQILYMKSVKGVGIEFLGIESDGRSLSSSVVFFPKLTSMVFDGLDEWEEWDFEITEEEEIMPRLRYLKIRNCPKLKALPDQLLQETAVVLEELEIFECFNLQKRYKKDAGEDWAKISHVPNIKIHYVGGSSSASVKDSQDEFSVMISDSYSYAPSAR